MKIGLVIKELMLKQNIEVADLAKRLGKTKQAVYDMLDKEDVNTSLLRELAAIFNVPITIFFDNSVNNNQSLFLLKKFIFRIDNFFQMLYLNQCTFKFFFTIQA